MNDSEQKELKKVLIYSDGACVGNPGVGGYGVVLLCGDKRKELMDGFKHTTNNRMELSAVIAGIKALKYPCDVTVYSDSKYVVENINNKHVVKWKDNNWISFKGQQILNPDLWEELLQLCELHKVTFVWIKGHNNEKENERADELSRKALGIDELKVDEGYIPPDKDENGQNLLASKIIKEGHPCRKCKTPVIKKIPRKTRKRRADQSFYYEYYIFCPSCKTMYMVEDGKRFYEDEPDLFSV